MIKKHQNFIANKIYWRSLKDLLHNETEEKERKQFRYFIVKLMRGYWTSLSWIQAWYFHLYRKIKHCASLHQQHQVIIIIMIMILIIMPGWRRPVRAAVLQICSAANMIYQDFKRLLKWHYFTSTFILKFWLKKSKSDNFTHRSVIQKINVSLSPPQTV